MAIKLNIYITDGSNVGSVNYGFPFGRSPSDDDMIEVLAKVAAALPDGFRLMNRGEAMMHYLREERDYRGPNMHIPQDGVWHDPASDVGYSDLNNEPEDFEDPDWA